MKAVNANAIAAVRIADSAHASARLAEEEEMAKKRRYWIRFHYGECPVCGRDKSFRERVYGRKPKRWQNRVVYLGYNQTYDNCIR